eukprot:12733886-Ditylum_brightwellii.AAC.1
MQDPMHMHMHSMFMYYYGGVGCVGGVGSVGGGYTGECKPNWMHPHESPRKNVYDDNKKKSDE